VLVGDEWNLTVPAGYHDHEVLKIDDLKFFVCPISFIASKSWEILELVNETTDPETGRIEHLPYAGALTEQPGWYREAVKIKRTERHSEWFTEKLSEKMKGDNHGR
jgi:hypothetical protein